MEPKYKLLTAVRLNTGLLVQIDAIIKKVEGFYYGAEEITFPESDVIQAYAPIMEKKKRTRRPKAVPAV